MKKEYVSPKMACETFVADEYVAACWKIKCNVPTGFGFIDKNGNGRFEYRVDNKLTPDDVAGCGIWHKGVEGVPDNGPVANAMWKPKRGNAYPVYYWRDGNGIYDIHFSKAEDAQWETNPNAS